MINKSDTLLVEKNDTFLKESNLNDDSCIGEYCFVQKFGKPFISIARITTPNKDKEDNFNDSIRN